MALEALTAKANTGGGTDQLAVIDTASGKAAAVALVDATGELIDGANPLAVEMDLPPGAATDATVAALSADIGDKADSSASDDSGSYSLISLFKRLLSKFTTYTTIPDNQVDAPAFRAIGQDVWNCSFSNVGSSVIAPEFNAPIVGTGVGYSQAAGALLVTTGTSTNAEFLARSARSWRSSMMLSYSCVLSQRIANNNFAYILGDLVGEGLSVTINNSTSITVFIPNHLFTAQNAGQFMFVGGIVGAAGVPGRYAIASVVPGVSINFTVAGWPATGSCTATLFGHSHYKHVYTSTVATNMLVNSQRRGWADTDTTATINTTASPGHVVKTHIEGRSVYWMDMIRASTAILQPTARASRIENLPDDNLDLYLFLWSYNGTTAPASTTTWTVSFSAVEKFAALPTYDQGSKPQGASWPKPVFTTGGSTVQLSTGTNAVGDVGLQYRANATGAATPAKVISAATTNATSTKATAGRVVSYDFHNNAAAVRYVKFYNKATAPTVGTDVPVKVIGIPAGGSKVQSIPGGVAFATGIAYAIVTGAADADATAVAANDVVGGFEYA